MVRLRPRVNEIIKMFLLYSYPVFFVVAVIIT